MVEGIQSYRFPEFRDRIRPFLENFAARDLDGFTADDLERDILNRNIQVWSIKDFQALALTSVTPNAVRIGHCAGVRRHEWQEAFDDEMRAWAKALGKKRIVATVRPGWAKWGRLRGYREKHREMCLEIG